jgi:hypothetical protein
MKYLTAENRRVVSQRTAKIIISTCCLCGPLRLSLYSLRFKNI